MGFYTILTACSSEPTSKAPDWTKQASRIVDNGYIVYVGNGGGPNQENAQFKAEGMALEDIANECSFIPKGTRVEDRYIEKGKYDYTAWVKVALEFQDCDHASKTTDPTEIKRVANSSFTSQLKRYQDFNETGVMPSQEEASNIQPLTDYPPVPAAAPGWAPTTHFYVVRQYIAYQNQVVILSPPTAYAPGAPETKAYVSAMQAPQQQVATAVAANPQLKTQPQSWSSLPDRPHVARPQNLQSKAAQAHELHAPEKSGAHSEGSGHHGGKGKRRRRPEKGP